MSKKIRLCGYLPLLCRKAHYCVCGGSAGLLVGMPRVLKPLVSACVIVFLLLPGTQSRAADVPNFEQPVDFNVREQNVNVLLTALFEEIAVPVSLNSELEGNVNGIFTDTARNVFDSIANAFSLIVYYDGAVAHIYKKNAVSRNLLPASARQSARVASIAKDMKLPDTNNTVTAEKSGVVVSGTERFVAQVQEIVASVKATPVRKKVVPKAVEVQLQPVSFPRESPIVYQVFKLKHAWAVDTQFPVGGRTITIPGVATLLNELINNSSPVPAVKSSTRDTNSLDGLRGQGLNKAVSIESQNNAVAAKDEVFGVPRIVADSRLNAIVIRDRQDKMKSYRHLIESLDVESGMVEIEATIIDINTDKSRELGINWRYQDGDVDALLGQGNSSDRALVAGAGLARAAGQGGILSFSLGEPANFLARVRALEQKGAAKVISKPHVITLSDVEAVIAATTEFFVRVAGNEEVDLFNVPVGTTLRVTPHIFHDNNKNRIKLLVNIEDGTQTQGASVDNIPVVERANISTQAVIDEGDSLLVGGLVRESFRNTREQVPVIGSVPLIGRLFGSTQKQASRVERLFMITPRLAKGLGFNGDASQSAIAGSVSNIISDAESRISSESGIQRSNVGYWSGDSRQPNPVSPGNNANSFIGTGPEKEATQELSYTEQGLHRYTRSDRVFATIRDNTFLTPFKVEPWVIGN